MSAKNVQVVVRARALIEKEMQADRSVLWNIEGNTIEPVDESVPQSQNPMVFDRVFGVDSTNKEVHEAIVAPLVISCLEGYNCTLFSYGPTSSGKLQTMEGSSDDTGIIPRVIEQLFAKATVKKRRNSRYLIRMAYFKIHNDKVYDLLKFQNHEVKVIEDVEGGIMICAREVVTSVKDQVFDLFKLGNRNRQLYSHKMRIKDSESDIIFRLIIEHEVRDGSNFVIPIAHLNLVTLAGSERVPLLEGLQKFVDREYVNRSSSILASIIAQKVEKAAVNYCQSKLTALLRNAIGGNAKIVLIADISLASMENTYFTLCFAQIAKCIRNKPTINIIDTTNGVLQQCLMQIAELEQQLEGVKEHCADLRGVAQTMQMIDGLHERINLISKAFVRSSDIIEEEFPNLLTRSSQLLLSSLEVRLLNVVRANAAYNAEFVDSGIKLPFELQFVRLSVEIGNEFITHFREEDQDELLVTDYLIDSNEYSCEYDLELAEKDDPGSAQLMNISFEYSDLEQSILTRITNEDLRRDLSNLSGIFTANYAQQLMSFKMMEKQNQMLFDEIAELTEKVYLEDKEKENLQTKIKELEQKIGSQGKQVSDNYKKLYEELLKEVDQKDMEYFQLLREKDALEKKVNDLTVSLGRIRSSLPQLETPETDMFTLQTEVIALKQKLVDQEFIINDMDAKHKRREDELLRRLNEKEIPKKRIVSDIMKTEKKVQTSPRLLKGQEGATLSTIWEGAECVRDPETSGNLPEKMLLATKAEDESTQTEESCQVKDL